jgi:hypothetical protein
MTTKFFAIFIASFALLSLAVSFVAGASGKIAPPKFNAGNTPALLPSATQPATGPTKPKSSSPSTQIFEPSSEQASFTDTVKFLRELDGEPEVVFQKFGQFTIPANDTIKERLIESQKTKLPVTVTYNEVSRKVIKVGPVEKPTAQ